MAALPPAPPTHVILVEPFGCGSHLHLLCWLPSVLGAEAVVQTLTLPGKKWHWRLRAGSTWAAQHIPPLPPHARATLCVSSMLNLAEVLALRPDLAAARKVVYMHENQLAYPAQAHPPPAASSSAAPAGAPPAAAEKAPMDFQFGWAQVLSCLCADVVAWNSAFNRDSFLAALPAHCRTMPDKAQRPDAAAIVARIRARSVVAYLPVDAVIGASGGGAAAAAEAAGAASAPTPPAIPAPPLPSAPTGRLRIGWNHRWEYDKDPAAFFDALAWLQGKGLQFEVVVLGESFAEVPPAFPAAHAALSSAGRVAHWGFAPDRASYTALLASCDVVVSTALHEFFGVSILEAVAAGCFPLCPARLAFPELLAPTPAEAAEARGAVEKVRALTAAPAPPAYPLPASSSGEGGSGGGSGGGDRVNGRGAVFTPPLRPSPHLYATPAQLRAALADAARAPGRIRAWRQAMHAAAAAAAAGSSGGGGGGSGDGGTEEGSGAAEGMPAKRARTEEGTHAGAGAAAAAAGGGELAGRGGVEAAGETGGRAVAAPPPAGPAFPGAPPTAAPSAAPPLIALERLSAAALAPLYRALLLHGAA
jgi:glycosyltransferase involved in cell wall biosynthesis